ncbi:GH3 family domain-containing protein [Rubritepida flocculans]|uniref:GH3 family domain-containing protein n=1 Tax=Rubritepida flocculans TaxID=182403 RepID=UPI000428D3BF|nr:GH3 auxin-responsive promoter family protein [Rubritepida flocculans]
MSVPFDATPFLRLTAAWRLRRLRRLDPAAAQAAVLRRLLARAAATRFGRAHGFARLTGHADFVRAVPLRRYEAMWEEFLKPAFPVLENISWPGRMPFFALSSGTSSGATKHIPVSAEMLRANRAAALETLAWHLANTPGARPLAGPGFMLGGSTALAELAPGVRAGDLSGIAAATIPAFLRPWSWPPTDLALEPDWSRKLARMVAEAPREARILGGTCSWLLLLLERLAQARGGLPFPDLGLLIHGGVAWAPYRARTLALLPPGCDRREVFAASEGFFAVADAGEEAGMRLILDGGVFFEFVPPGELDAPAPRRLTIAQVEPGVDYALVVSTCAGLFGHVVGDVVRFTSLAPPRVVVVGRTAWTLSAFGEHLSGEEIHAALAGIPWREFMVGAEMEGGLGRHRWIIEAAAEALADPAALAALLDARLMAGNDDYRAHREGGQLAPPVVERVPPGRFAAWMEAIGKGGGQHKVPRVVAEPARFAAFRDGLLGRG